MRPRVAWFELEGTEHRGERCGAALHERPAPAGAYLVVLRFEDGVEAVVQPMCEPCMDALAAGYGVTAARGARSLEERSPGPC